MSKSLKKGKSEHTGRKEEAEPSRSKKESKALKALKKREKSSKKIKDSSKCIGALPPEILCRVVACLDARSLCRASSVSSEWNSLANDETIWSNLYRSAFSIAPARPFFKRIPAASWKMNFAAISKKVKLADDYISGDNEIANRYVSRAMLQMEHTHFEAALADFQTAEQLKRDFPTQNADLDVPLLLARRGTVLRMLGNKAAAQRDIDQAVTLAPKASNYVRIRGNWYHEDGQLDKALKDYDTALEIDPAIPAYYFKRAMILLDLKQLQLAMKNLDFAIRLDPKNSEYYCARGRIYSNTKQLDQALADLDEAVRLVPDKSSYRHWRGRLLREKEDIPRAHADFDKAVQLSGDDVDYAWRSITHSQMRRFDEALSDIKTAIAKSPQNPHHHQFAGILAFARGKPHEAVQSLSTAIQLQPRVSTNYVWRAAVQIDLGDQAAAMKDLDAAVQLDPTEVPLFWRGLLYLSMSQPKKALYDLKASLKESTAKPTSAELPAQGPPVHPPSRVLFWLAVANRLNDDEDEASRLFARCVTSAQSETKATKHTEPAKVSLLLDSDVSSAKALYRHFLEGFNTADAPKTELTHLDLLGRLFPGNKAIGEVKPWLQAQLKLHTGGSSPTPSPRSSKHKH